MKTVLQELLEKIELEIEEEKNMRSIGIGIWGLFQAKNLVNNLLEKEKEQIIESYYEGHTAPYFSPNGNDVEKQAEEYYNQTYNQNKKYDN